MKFLKFFILPVVVIASGFFMTGLFFPNVRSSNEVLIKAPVDKVFKAFEDTTLWKDYLPGFKSMKTISGKPYQPGWTVEVVFADEGEEYKVTEKLVEYDPGKKYYVTNENEILFAEIKNDFLPEGSFTRVKSRSVVNGKNILWRSVFVYSSEAFSESSQDQLDSLKKICELKGTD